MTQTARRELETLDEAAARIHCHPRTLRRRIASGELPAVRLGGKLLRVDPADVDALCRPLLAARLA